MCIPQTHTHIHHIVAIVEFVVECRGRNWKTNIPSYNTMRYQQHSIKRQNDQQSNQLIDSFIGMYVCKYVRSFYFVHFMFVCPSIRRFVVSLSKYVSVVLVWCTYRERGRERGATYIIIVGSFLISFFYSTSSHGGGLLGWIWMWICVLITKSGTVIVRSFRSMRHYRRYRLIFIILSTGRFESMLDIIK